MLYSLIDTHSAAAAFYIVSVVVLSKYLFMFQFSNKKHHVGLLTNAYYNIMVYGYMRRVYSR